MPYGTNAAAIAAAGVPSIVFGPGSIDQAHTADEWLALDQLAQASEALYQFGRTGSIERVVAGLCEPELRRVRRRDPCYEASDAR